MPILEFRINHLEKRGVTMGLLDMLKGKPQQDGREKEQPYPMGAGVVVLSNPEMVEVTAMPRHLARRLWAIVEKDAAYTYLSEEELRWIRFAAERISKLADLIEPEVWHPVILNEIDQAIMEWIDEENSMLLGYLRLKRSWRGMERRLSTVTAHGYAY